MLHVPQAFNFLSRFVCLFILAGDARESEGSSKDREGESTPAADSRETGGEGQKDGAVSPLHRLAAAMAEVHPLHNVRCVIFRSKPSAAAITALE